MSRGRPRRQVPDPRSRRRPKRESAVKVVTAPRRRRSTELLVLAAILLAGLLLRGLYLWELVGQPGFSAPTIDAGFHDYWARALAFGDWTPPVGRPDPLVRTTPYLRPPGYPFFLSLVHRLAGTGYLAPRITQMGLGLVGALLAYLIGRRWYGRDLGLGWAAMMAFYWAFIFFEGEFHAPALLIPLLLTLVGLLGRWSERGTWRYLLAAGGVLGLSALVRPNVLLFVPAIVLWVCWVAHRRRNWRGMPWAIAGFVLAVCLVVAPAAVRNYRVSGDFVLISSNAGINLFIGNNEHATGEVTDDIPGLGQFATCYDYPALVANLEEQLGRSLTHSEVSAHFTGQALSFIWEHPFDFLRLTARKAYLFWGPSEITHNKAVACERRYSAILRYLPGSFAGVLSLGLIGGIMMIRDRRQRRPAESAPEETIVWRHSVSVLVLVLMLTYFVSVLPFFISARYRVPILPFLLLFAAYGLCGAIRLVRTGNLRQAGLWVAAGLVLYFVTGGSPSPLATDRAKWHCDRGLAYDQRGESDRAEVEYRKALRIIPGFKAAEINLAAALAKQGDLDESIARAVEALRRNPNVAALHNNLALTLTKAGRPAEAIEHYQKALQLQPDLVEVRFNVASLLMQVGQVGDAAGHLAEAVKLRPDSGDAHLRLADALRALGRADEAEQHYHRAVALQPRQLEAQLNLAALLASRGKMEEATTAFEQAAKIAPESAAAHNGLGTMMLRAGQWSAAERHYRTAVRLDPKLVSAHSNLGIALARQNKLTEATEALRRAVHLGPNNAEAHFLLGDCLQDEGKLAEAAAEYQAALRINPSHTRARQALKKASGGRE